MLSKSNSGCLTAALTLCTLVVSAQVKPGQNPPPTPPPVAASASVQPMLIQLQQAAKAADADIAQLNIRKWKVGSDGKQDAQAKADSLQRNLTAALPGMIAQVQAAPEDFAASFKLYRTLGVLFDVMSSLTESAGAFGPKSEFESLAGDLNRIDQARRALGDRLQWLAAAKDAEIIRLRTQVKAQQQAAATPPKKIIVDENEPAKKTPKKSVTKKKPPAQQPPPSPPQ